MRLRKTWQSSVPSLSSHLSSDSSNTFTLREKQLNILTNTKKILAACALALLGACTQESAPQHEVRHHVTQAPEQNGHMTVYQQAQPDNSWLYWYLLLSNGHTYYYSSPTYVTNYTSLPMTRAASNDVKD